MDNNLEFNKSYEQQDNKNYMLISENTNIINDGTYYSSDVKCDKSHIEYECDNNLNNIIHNLITNIINNTI